MTHSLYVCQHGDDLNSCTNWTKPCRTVRHAVKMSRDGDEIYINYTQGTPYMECENATQLLCSIELTKSLSFHGFNGKAEIQCRKCPEFFTITSPSFNITRIYFSNLVISNSRLVAELGAKANTELEFQNMLVRDNNLALYSKYSNDCSIKIFNSSFEHNTNTDWGIYLRCAYLTVHINSSFFTFTPILFTNVGNEPTRLTKTRILVRHTIFNGKRIQECSITLMIKLFAAISNITIIDSVFKNHFADCRFTHRNEVPTLQIYYGRSKVRKVTIISLNNLTFENNYNDWAALLLCVGYQDHIEADIMIKNCIFRNNSVVMRVSDRCLKKSFPVKNSPTIILENNTFEENFYDMSKLNGAAAILFRTVKSRVLSCRFINNRPGPNPYTGVVTIYKEALVTFFNCYFKNLQTTKRADQLFASGNQAVKFHGENTFNLVALKGSQTVFSRLPITLKSRVIMKKNFKIICPQGYKVNTQRKCENVKKAYCCNKNIHSRKRRFHLQ